LPIVCKRLCRELFFGVLCAVGGAVGKEAAVLPPFNPFQGTGFFFLVEVVVFEVDSMVLQVRVLDPHATDAFCGGSSSSHVPLCESPGASGYGAIILKPSLGLVLNLGLQLFQSCGLAEEAREHTLPLKADLSFLGVVLEVWELGVIDSWTDPDAIGREVESCTLLTSSAEVQFDLFLERSKHLTIVRFVSFCDRVENLCEDTAMLVVSLVAIEIEGSPQLLHVEAVAVER
jgi:hypothetical protein